MSAVDEAIEKCRDHYYGGEELANRAVADLEDLRNRFKDNLDELTKARDQAQTMAIRAGILERRNQELNKMLREAFDHLEWCDYGDEFESASARRDNLPERLASILKVYEG